MYLGERGHNILGKMKWHEPNWLFNIGSLAFLALALLGSLLFAWIDVPSGLSVGIYLIAVALINVSYYFGKGVQLRDCLIPLFLFFFVGVLFFSRIFGAAGILAAYLATCGLVFLVVCREKVVYPLLALGAVLVLLNMYLRGVPLLDPALRAQGYSILSVLGFALYLVGLNLYADQKKGGLMLPLVFGIFLSLLLGYRSAVALVVLSVLIALSFRRTFEPKKVGIILGALLVLVLLLGQFNAFQGEENPLLLIPRRAGFTYERYGDIVNSLGTYDAPGSLWLAHQPRRIIGVVTLGEYKIINAGLFGFLLLDGGLLELAVGCALMGMWLGYLYQNRLRVRPFYGLLLIYFLVSIEVGLDIVYLMAFFASAFALSWT